jgi:hydantoinase/carbamoylase family amidase
MEELGLEIDVDPIGNIRARLEGTSRDASPVLTGSHIDSVIHGGKYDGPVGVICGLEALTLLKEREFQPERPLELIVFVEEEGVNFGAAMAGSKALVGTYSVDDLKGLINDEGVSMYEAARGFGLDPDQMGKHVMKPGEVHAMIEVHIEQSIVLDTEKIPLGVVTGIAGMRRFRIEIEGQSNHAGATPMSYRRDPMAAAAEVISTIEETARSRATPATVGTVGKVLCHPNMVNVIPQSVEVFVDTRDLEPAGMEAVTGAFMERLDRIGTERGLKTTVESMGAIEPTECSERVVEVLQRSAEAQGIDCKRMISGALHDAAVLAGVTEVAMLFVPSVDGRSHCPEEHTAIEDIAKACDALTGALVELSKL